ncbi:hypothetical protein PROFUN_08814 [Planoprotostelium fungivorum]|uniref:Uncharacterized protein n=1 Tax=Planoprotostelium fungivorum TaxID=1890364 RepID=A0A2P6MVT0_9EUKA|nr:hypothetical protein PROFUN_08814 [Planoprotostelium fungivorum]
MDNLPGEPTRPRSGSNNSQGSVASQLSVLDDNLSICSEGSVSTIDELNPIPGYMRPTDGSIRKNTARRTPSSPAHQPTNRPCRTTSGTMSMNSPRLKSNRGSIEDLRKAIQTETKHPSPDPSNPLASSTNSLTHSGELSRGAEDKESTKATDKRDPEKKNITGNIGEKKEGVKAGTITPLLLKRVGVDNKGTFPGPATPKGKPPPQLSSSTAKTKNKPILPQFNATTPALIKENMVLRQQVEDYRAKMTSVEEELEKKETGICELNVLCSRLNGELEKNQEHNRELEKHIITISTLHLQRYKKVEEREKREKEARRVKEVREEKEDKEEREDKEEKEEREEKEDKGEEEEEIEEEFPFTSPARMGTTVLADYRSSVDDIGSGLEMDELTAEEVQNRLERRVLKREQQFYLLKQRYVQVLSGLIPKMQSFDRALEATREENVQMKKSLESSQQEVAALKAELMREMSRNKHRS